MKKCISKIWCLTFCSFHVVRLGRMWSPGWLAPTAILTLRSVCLPNIRETEELVSQKYELCAAEEALGGDLQIPVPGEIDSAIHFRGDHAAKCQRWQPRYITGVIHIVALQSRSQCAQPFWLVVMRRSAGFRRFTTATVTRFLCGLAIIGKKNKE